MYISPMPHLYLRVKRFGDALDISLKGYGSKWPVKPQLSNCISESYCTVQYISELLLTFQPGLLSGRQAMLQTHLGVLITD